jgi:hypothetical protein
LFCFLENHPTVTSSSIDDFLFKKFQSQLIIRGVGTWIKWGQFFVKNPNMDNCAAYPQPTNTLCRLLSASCGVFHSLLRSWGADNFFLSTSG